MLSFCRARRIRNWDTAPVPAASHMVPLAAAKQARGFADLASLSITHRTVSLLSITSSLALAHSVFTSRPVLNAPSCLPH
jgi:hypothetical protein